MANQSPEVECLPPERWRQLLLLIWEWLEIPKLDSRVFEYIVRSIEMGGPAGGFHFLIKLPGRLQMNVKSGLSCASFTAVLLCLSQGAENSFEPHPYRDHAGNRWANL
jgi:hypothetical protein